MAPVEELARDPGPGERTDGIAELAGRVRPTDLARDRRLPVLPALDGLLPASGLRRGTSVAVGAAPGVTGATSLALALAVGASRAGSWVAAVGLGSLGLVAASEMGVAFERLVLVADPGRDRDGWASVLASLLDGFDVVLVAVGPVRVSGADPGGGGAGGRGGRLRPVDARRLVARARERGAVLVAVGGDLPGQRSPLQLTATSSRWEGLGEGWGHLRGRRVTVDAGGRGEAARGRRAELWLPGPGGAVSAVEPVVEPIPLRSHRLDGRRGAGQGAFRRRSNPPRPVDAPGGDARPREVGAPGGDARPREVGAPGGDARPCEVDAPGGDACPSEVGASGGDARPCEVGA